MTEGRKEKCKNCKYHFIEEISFDYPQSCCNKTNPCHTTEEWLKCDDFEYSKDYITNIQQENEDFKTIIKQYVDIVLHDRKVIDEKDKEIERLNNIINELKDYLKYQIENLDFEKDTKAKMLCGMVLVMLDKEELKKSGNNE